MINSIDGDIPMASAPPVRSAWPGQPLHLVTGYIRTPSAWPPAAGSSSTLPATAARVNLDIRREERR
jgi:hypothetical protein